MVVVVVVGGGRGNISFDFMSIHKVVKDQASRKKAVLYNIYSWYSTHFAKHTLFSCTGGFGNIELRTELVVPGFLSS